MSDSDLRHDVHVFGAPLLTWDAIDPRLPKPLTPILPGLRVVCCQSATTACSSPRRPSDQQPPRRSIRHADGVLEHSNTTSDRWSRPSRPRDERGSTSGRLRFDESTMDASTRGGRRRHPESKTLLSQVPAQDAAGRLHHACVRLPSNPTSTTTGERFRSTASCVRGLEPDRIKDRLASRISALAMAFQNECRRTTR